jgi:hypothetical protein
VSFDDIYIEIMGSTAKPRKNLTNLREFGNGQSAKGGPWLCHWVYVARSVWTFSLRSNDTRAHLFSVCVHVRTFSSCAYARVCVIYVAKKADENTEHGVLTYNDVDLNSCNKLDRSDS